MLCEQYEIGIEISNLKAIKTSISSVISIRLECSMKLEFEQQKKTNNSSKDIFPFHSLEQNIKKISVQNENDIRNLNNWLDVNR